MDVILVALMVGVTWSLETDVVTEAVNSAEPVAVSEPVFVRGRLTRAWV